MRLTARVHARVKAGRTPQGARRGMAARRGFLFPIERGGTGVTGGVGSDAGADRFESRAHRSEDRAQRREARQACQSHAVRHDRPTPISEMDQIVGIKIVDLFCTQLLKSAVGVPTTHKISRGPSSWVGRAARRGGEYLRAGTTHSGAGAGAGRDAHPPVISLTTDSAERPLDVGRLLH